MAAMAWNLDDLALPTAGREHVHHWFWGDPRTRFAGWQVQGAGFADARNRAAHPIPRRRMQQWLLLGCHAGGGWFSDVRGQRHPWPAGQAVLLAPGQLHAYGEGDRAWQEWWLLFDGPAAIAAQAAGELAADARPLPAPPAYAALAPAVVAAGDRLAAGDAAGGARLLALLAEALALRRPAAGPVASPALAAVRAELVADPGRAWNLQLLARRHGLGYDAMRRGFRQAYALAPLAFLRRERVNASCRLLLEGASVAAAAQAAGFADPFFFSRTFRRLIGLSPRAFVRQAGRGG